MMVTMSTPLEATSAGTGLSNGWATIVALSSTGLAIRAVSPADGARGTCA